MNDDIKKALNSLNNLLEKQDRLDEKQDKQTDKITELEVSIARQEVSLNLHSEKTEKMADELKEMNKQLAVYNQELQIHIAGVTELKETNKLIRLELAQRDTLINQRLDEAELPIKWAKTSGNIAKWVGSIAAAAAIIYNVVTWAIEFFK